MKLDHELTVLGTYSECGSVMSLIITRNDSRPIETDELATLLIMYASKLVSDEPPPAN